VNSWESAVSHLVVLRFPLLTAFFVLIFPVIALKAAKPLLANLFDLNGLQAIAVTITACITAWTSLITGWVVVTYGPIRFGFNSFSVLRIQDIPPWQSFAIVSLLPLPLIFSAAVYSVREQATTWFRFLAGVAGGYLISTALFVSGWTALDWALNNIRLFQIHSTAPSVALSLRGYVDGDGNILSAQIVVVIGFLLTLGVYFAIGFGHYFRLRPLRHIPSLAYVLLLCSVACWTLTGVSFFCDAYRLPVSLVVLVYLTVTAQISRSDHFYNMYPGGREEMPSAAQVLRVAGLDSVILVACNGGGIQSAAWTAKVLTELDRYSRTIEGISPDLFARSVRAISSVSGGSVGAMHFTAAYQRDGGLPAINKDLDDVIRRAEASSLDEIAWGLVYPDLWKTLTPFLLKRFSDRGNALERSMARALPCSDESLSSWRELVALGERPANLFNATLSESGGRFLISNADFRRPHEACSQFYDLYKGRDLSVVTAARLSATFPFVTPAARPNDKSVARFHVVDGGYYDNYGMATLAEWLQEGVDVADNPIRRVLVLQIRGFPPVPPERPNRTHGWFYQLYAPLATMIHARSCGQLAHNDIEFDLLTKVCHRNGIEVDKVIFQFQSKTEMGIPPLSWHLTNRQKKTIDRVWQEVGTEGCARLSEFLRATRAVGQEGEPIRASSSPSGSREVSTSPRLK
jgi:Patatin-like phospholipase